MKLNLIIALTTLILTVGCGEDRDRDRDKDNYDLSAALKAERKTYFEAIISATELGYASGRLYEIKTQNLDFNSITNYELNSILKDMTNSYKHLLQ
jgi:hypothetical protein